MKIVTWNVNGIRACNKSTSIKSLLDSLDADIICLQETKITSKEICFKKLRKALSLLITSCEF